MFIRRSTSLIRLVNTWRDKVSASPKRSSIALLKTPVPSLADFWKLALAVNLRPAQALQLIWKVFSPLQSSVMDSP